MATELALSLLHRSWSRRARLHASRIISVLVALLLPLQGISGAMAAIQAPAHYHMQSAPRAGTPAALRRVLASMQASMPSTPAVQARSAQRISSAWLSHAAASTHADSVSVEAMLRGLHSHAHAHPHPHHAALPAAQSPAVAQHHGQHRAGRPPPVDTIHGHAPLDHRATGNALGLTGSSIGHHAHAFADAGVVYVDGNQDEPDGGATGKHAPTTDATLTGWWMPLRRAMGMQSLPAATWRFRSRLPAPALRPPSAHVAL